MIFRLARDCATCHTAAATEFFLSLRAHFVDESPERFLSTYPTDVVPLGPPGADPRFGTDSTHMLSYAGTSLFVSSRVANETAAVLKRRSGG